MAELVDFLLARLDEAGLAELFAHEPKRTYAAYTETGGGRCETRGAMFTGCLTCSRIRPYTEFPGYHNINVEAWPCSRVRSLALPFAEDSDYREDWLPQYAAFASGKFVHPDGDLLA